jgi:hypothetical protein
VTEGRAVGGLAIWAGLSLAPGVRLSARDTTAWSPVFLPIDGLPAGAGRLSVQLDWSRARRRWSVVFEDARGTRHVAEHAPLFAWGVLRAALLTR